LRYWFWYLIKWFFLLASENISEDDLQDILTVNITNRYFTNLNFSFSEIFIGWKHWF
jgi:hypothetical protein